MTDRADPRGAYSEAVAAASAELERLQATSGRLSTARVATFLSAAAAFLVMDVGRGGIAAAAGWTGVLLLAVFTGEVAAHRRVRRRMRWQEALRAVAREGLLRMDRRWGDLEASLPPDEARAADPPAGHPYARDLDVFGAASLARLTGPVTSERGRARLHGWLLGPAPAEEVARRRDAVRELAPRMALRHEMSAHGRLHGTADPPGTEAFLGWAEGEPWLLHRPTLRVAAIVLPVVLLALLVADFRFGAPPLWIVPALAHAELIRRHWRRLQADFLLAEGGVALLAAYVPQIGMLEAEEPSSACLRDLREDLRSGGAWASARLRGLAALLDTAQSRRNIFYAPFAAILLTDFHLAWALDRWRGASGRDVRRWLESLGAWEALSALATVAHDHRDWAYPTTGEEPVVRAVGLGHPLLTSGSCVRNDVDVGPPGTFLLVTGSNMSGKSTLLRALGANVVLAGAGAPVCAHSLTLPPVRVRTSIRVDDSLAEGVSLFMAELLRIRSIVEDADASEQGGPILYLLDEILHGTNTAERRVAARAVIRHLLGRDALGAVSTHDLTLAQAPDLEAAAVPVHFRESVGWVEGRTHLTFDYTLRPGLATTRNALKLLDAVGLGDLVAGGEAAEEDGNDAREGDPAE